MTRWLIITFQNSLRWVLSIKWYHHDTPNLATKGSPSISCTGGQWRRLHREWGHASPLLQMAGRGEHRERKNSKQETDQTVLTITKALTKATNCTSELKNSGVAPQKFFPASLYQPITNEWILIRAQQYKIWTNGHRLILLANRRLLANPVSVQPWQVYSEVAVAC